MKRNINTYLSLLSMILAFESSAQDSLLYKVQVNFANTPLGAIGWNDMASTDAAAGTSITLFTESEDPTPYSLTLGTTWSGTTNVGGMPSSLYMQEIVDSYFWTDDTPEILTLDGLDPAKIYSFEFLASRDKEFDRRTIFTIDGQSDTVQASFNADQLVRIEGITPQPNGEIEITVENIIGADFYTVSYLNAMVIEVYSPEGSSSGGEENQPVAHVEGQFDQLIIGNPTDSVPDFANVWIEGNDNPQIVFNNPAQNVDERLWLVSAIGDEFRILTENDDFTQVSEAMVIKRGVGTEIENITFPSGNVGIGTENPDAKLTVAGEIHAQTVKVTVDAGVVPDYVFEPDYERMSLEEVEEYIDDNKHLPNIKSAKEYEEIGGIELKELNLKLLEKLEELTLYIIEQNKEITELKEVITKLKEDNQ